jgi:hypothetical protein
MVINVLRYYESFMIFCWKVTEVSKEELVVIQDFHDVLVFNEPERKSRRAIAAFFLALSKIKCFREGLMLDSEITAGVQKMQKVLVT